MQKLSFKPIASERRVVRKWRIAVVGFYGSLLALMVIFAAATANRNVHVARTETIAASQK